MALLFVCIATPEVYYGTGRHVYYLNAHQRVMAVKLNWVTQAFHIMSTCFGKISIVILMLRIIGNSKRQAWFLYSIISALFAISVICVAFIFAQCTPASALWDPAVVGKCWSPVVQQNYGYFTACMCKSCYLNMSMLWLILDKLTLHLRTLSWLCFLSRFCGTFR